MTRDSRDLSRAQQAGLIALRTLIGWHFLYEGYFKLMLPGWTPAGVPFARWSSAGYLKAATGPFAFVFQRMAESSWLPTLDLLIAATLLLVGLSLVLGLFTDAGCVGALGLLALFYLSAIPTSGMPEAHAEGAYLFVNKNLVEAGAVFVLLAFRTGRIAGLDLLRKARTSTTPRAQETLE